MPGTPSLNTATRFQSFPGITQVDTGGHVLVVTINPTEPGFPVQTVERRFRTGDGSFNFCTLSIIFGSPCTHRSPSVIYLLMFSRQQ